MDASIFKMLHDASHQLAIETARSAGSGEEASAYIDAYEKVFEFLESKQKECSKESG